MSFESRIPWPVLFHAIVSFHLTQIMKSEQQDEANFHWRMVRYYRSVMQEHVPQENWQTEQELVDGIEQTGNTPHLIEAIKKFNLLELDQQED